MYFLGFIPLLIFSAPLFSQHTSNTNTQNLKPITVSLTETSYFVINGSTNVNRFHCAYDQLSTEPIQIQLQHFPDSVEIKHGRLVLQTRLFDCRNPIINNDFQELLQSEDYPNIGFEVLGMGLPSDIKLSSSQKGEQPEIRVTAIITMINVTQQYSFPIKIMRQSDNSFTLEGTIKLNLPDYGITPPTKFLGLIEVNPEVSIDFFANLKVVYL